MALVTIDARDKTPIYTQVERALRAAMATGRLVAGAHLPTVRQLAVERPRKRGGGRGPAPEKARPPREHEKRLRAFATRVLAEASSAGFSLEEIVREISSHQHVS